MSAAEVQRLLAAAKDRAARASKVSGAPPIPGLRRSKGWIWTYRMVPGFLLIDFMFHE